MLVVFKDSNVDHYSSGSVKASPLKTLSVFGRSCAGVCLAWVWLGSGSGLTFGPGLWLGKSFDKNLAVAGAVVGRTTFLWQVGHTARHKPAFHEPVRGARG